MLVKLIEVKKQQRGGVASLNEIYVNSDHIISVIEENFRILTEDNGLGLSADARFSKVIISEGSHTRSLTVVGTPSEVYNKIIKRQVLRG